MFYILVPLLSNNNTVIVRVLGLVLEKGWISWVWFWGKRSKNLRWRWRKIEPLNSSIFKIELNHLSTLKNKKHKTTKNFCWKLLWYTNYLTYFLQRGFKSRRVARRCAKKYFRERKKKKGVIIPP